MSICPRTVIGGAWTVNGGSVAAASVASGQAQFNLTAGVDSRKHSRRRARLDSADELHRDGDFSTSATPETGGAYIGLVARNLGSSSAILHTWLCPNGTVWLVAQRGSAGCSPTPFPGSVPRGRRVHPEGRGQQWVNHAVPRETVSGRHLGTIELATRSFRRRSVLAGGGKRRPASEPCVNSCRNLAVIKVRLHYHDSLILVEPT